jgi:uncharacterized protein (TIGR04562 family)
VPTTAFSWETLRTIIGGDSALDLAQLDLTDLAQAGDFLAAYGFDGSDPNQRAELAEIRADAVAFLEDRLLEPGEAVLPEVRRELDPRRLLVWASEDSGGLRQRWACALLRVMHTRAHVPSEVVDEHADEIRRQIFGRLEAGLVRTPEGLFLGTGDDAVPLVDFRRKPSKARASILMKLLHKPQNVAATVFDHVGVRFVTETRLDALRVIYYLRSNNVVMFAHVQPTRSRNSLVDLDRLEPAVRAWNAALARGAATAEDRMAALQLLASEMEPRRGDHNPFSDESWCSIQFTGRQLIRLASVPRPRRFFFPFEVQLLDRQSRDRAASGAGSHHAYKARQRQEVRRRVLGSLVAAR